MPRPGLNTQATVASKADLPRWFWLAPPSLARPASQTSLQCLLQKWGPSVPSRCIYTHAYLLAAAFIIYNANYGDVLVQDLGGTSLCLQKMFIFLG